MRLGYRLESDETCSRQYVSKRYSDRLTVVFSLDPSGWLAPLSSSSLLPQE
jgi:hypothetical protein